jgi:cellulose synthase/poly-beta-1,6-N-acetylglucosamine synthase-like glycosyltransferase
VTLTLTLYLATLLLLAVHALHRLQMVRRFRRRAWSDSAFARAGELPVVTVQLPLFNERTVAARLLRAVGALDYPREKLEVQILDDSTDDTRAIVDREAARLVAAGLDVRVVRRAERGGFKAGALEHGMRTARGELLCVFDADFAPRPNFLRALVGHFADPTVGMVQARWDHENRDESALTRAQSVLLDGHFVIEHSVRHDNGLFFNFNGTAGIWRAATIRAAGGWQHDTLTEDLDLSYRAQLAGWRFVYAPLVTAPAEVPPSISAFKSQQHRWAKGSVQVARKQLKTILRARIPRRVKLEAVMHLCGNAGYPLVLALAVLMPLTLGIKAESAAIGWLHLASFLLCTVSVVLFYETSQRAVGRGLAARLFEVPAAVALGIGMSVSQTRAVLAGLVGGTGEFVRTPKRGEGARGNGYSAAMRGWPGVELVLAAWFALALARAVRDGLWGALPFLALFLAGFAWVGVLSIGDRVRATRGAERA